MENQDLISIVVPIYKVEKYLKKCIDSIINQTYKKIEIILVDDGSPDNCGMICDEYAKKDNRIKVIHKENGGISEARNFGIEIAKGKYITFVDSDDYISNNYIEYMYQLLNENEADISVCCVQVVNDKNKKYNIKETKKEIYTTPMALENMLYSEGIEVAAYAKLYPIEFFKDIKFPVGEKYEDIAIMANLFSQARKIAFGNQKCYFYYTRNGSTSKSGFNDNELDYIKNVNKMLAFISNHYNQLEKAILRYRVYSCFRILRILLFSKNKNDEIQDKMIENIKKFSHLVYQDKRAPKRDKIAIILFNIGLPVFKLVWFLYSKFTGRIL